MRSASVENSRSVRIAFGLAHDVRLHAIRWVPRRCQSANGSRMRRKLSTVSRGFVDELEQLIVGNEVVIARTQNVGNVSPELAVSAGITGPMLRACGVNYDVRKVDGYGFYPRFKFRIPLGEHGDTYDRLMMRVLEMGESVGILKQAFEQIPAGPIINPKVKIRAFRPPVGGRLWAH